MNLVAGIDDGSTSSITYAFKIEVSAKETKSPLSAKIETGSVTAPATEVQRRLSLSYMSDLHEAALASILQQLKTKDTDSVCVQNIAPEVSKWLYDQKALSHYRYDYFLH